MYRSLCILIFLNIFFSVNLFAQHNVIVSQDGSGNYTSIQDAINAAPTGRTTAYSVYIKKGKYREVVNIPANKPFIKLIGESLSETIISYDNYSGKPIPTGGTYGTSTSATLTINANDCMVMNLSIENSTAYGIDASAIPVAASGDGPQAIALNVSGDRVVFLNCRFNGGQDTVFAGGVGKRDYFKNCYIDGNTDFIFGDATAIFDTCIIYPRTRLDKSGSGYITAVNTKSISGYGYVFRDCKITKNRGYTFYTLGRPWQNDTNTISTSKSHNKVAFLNTTMGSSINSVGWSVWDAGTNTSFITYVEFNSLQYNATAVNISNRVKWSQQLTPAVASNYYNNDTVFMNASTPQKPSWNPYSYWPVLNNVPFTPEIAVSNFIAKKTVSNSLLTWNISWPMQGIVCDLYRSTDKINFSKINTQTTTEDSACNLNYTDTVPPSGVTFYYIIKASKASFTSITSDTATVSSTPTLTVYRSMGSFLQGLGSPSASQTYLVSGVNLTNSLVITPPINFEVSSNGGITWFNNNNPLQLTPINGILPTTNIMIRLNGSVPGSYNDTIFHSSMGATTIPLIVKGKILSTPLVNNSFLLQEWTMLVSNMDSGSIRSVGLLPTLPTFSNLGLSTLLANPPYSNKGQAFATDPTIGKWSIGIGLNRGTYKQFMIVSDSTHFFRIDSLLLNSSFLQSANGAVAVVYSRSGFRNDSAEVVGGISTNGINLPSSAYGAYAHPILLGKLNGNNDSTLHLVLKDSGVYLNNNDTLTIRLYYGLGSTNAPRFAYLKNVIVKGQSLNTPLPVGLLRFNATPSAGKILLDWRISSDFSYSNILIEHSNDGVHFFPLVELGVSDESFVDLFPYTSSNYYRLKLLGRNGVYTYSNVLHINQLENAPLIDIYPNPAKNSVTIHHPINAGKGNIKIINMEGKCLMQTSINQNNNQTILSISSLPKGIYRVIYQNERNSQQMVLLKQ